MNRILRKTRRFIIDKYKRIGLAERTKYFCIGRNKTGTTSLKKAFAELGFVVGQQRIAEQIYDEHYFNDNFAPLIEYCKSAEVFQDVPFSCPGTFQYLDRAFPGSKFILTIRDSAEQWYNSLTSFHSKKFGKGKLPTVENLRNAAYVRPGFMYNTVRLHGTTDDDPYRKSIMTAHYKAHNLAVANYFTNRPQDLLILNLRDADAYRQFTAFINVSSPYSDFPWENKTSPESLDNTAR